jgi:aryl-alcohol dehydrogenase-like predicted oxidoreductase
MSTNKLAIGTAQFGLDYGINNPRGQVSLEDAATILKEARDHGVDTLDTAIAYGNSEQRLGEIGIDGWQIVTKLPPVPEECPDVRGWILSTVEQSMIRLKTGRIHGLLLHKPSQLLEQHGNAIHDTLSAIKHDGRVDKIGISIYDPEELERILLRYPLDLVQAPFNILDRRLCDSGWMERLHGLGVELHVRSVFLQGLLLMNTTERLRRFPRWKSLWQVYDEWLENGTHTPLEACLAHALSFPGIARVVVGIDSPLHFREIVHASAAPAPCISSALSTDDAGLLNPARWTL